MPRKVELMIGSIECRSRRPLRSLQARRTARVSRMLHRQCPSLSLHSSDRMYAIAIGGAPDDRFADSFRGTIVVDLALSQMTRLNASRFIHPKGAASTTFRGSTSSLGTHVRPVLYWVSNCERADNGLETAHNCRSTNHARNRVLSGHANPRVCRAR